MTRTERIVASIFASIVTIITLYMAFTIGQDTTSTMYAQHIMWTCLLLVGTVVLWLSIIFEEMRLK